VRHTVPGWEKWMMLRGMRAATLLAAMLCMAAAEARTVRWVASGDPNTGDPNTMDRHSQNVGAVTMVLQQIYDPLIQRQAAIHRVGVPQIPRMANRQPYFRWARVE
jgi:ABC-type transport system substrate-binding protein